MNAKARFWSQYTLAITLFALLVLEIGARLILSDRQENARYLKISADFPQLQELLRDKKMFGEQRSL